MSAPTPVADPELVARLRADLAAAAYTVEAVGELLGPLAAAALAREQVLPAQRVTVDVGTPLATLVRLFGLGDAVDSEEAAAALPTLGLDGAAVARPGARAGAGRGRDLRPAALRRRGPRLVDRLRPHRAADPGTPA